MNPLCPLCGYPLGFAHSGPGPAATSQPVTSTGSGSVASSQLCPHCESSSTDVSLKPLARNSQDQVGRAGPKNDRGEDNIDRSADATASRFPGINSRGMRSIVDGLMAVPKGMVFLAGTRKVKRLLLPPFLLTLISFVLLLRWAWSGTQNLLSAARNNSTADLDLPYEWVESSVEWLIRQSVVVWLAQAGATLMFFVLSSLVAMWAFSIVYEALAGPFLDEIQGRLEHRWFGQNPRDELERPVTKSTRSCFFMTLIGAAVGLLIAAIAAPTVTATWTAWIAYPVLVGVAVLPLVGMGLWDREYGRWLAWIVHVEGHTLWVSVKASLLGGVILLLALPLRLLPFGVGYLIFGAIAGFTTAISLLDIPFSRRQWPFATRLAFMKRHWPAMASFGAVSSLVFVIPLLGPLLMVPSASVGGLWLLCRLDKRYLSGPSLD